MRIVAIIICTLSLSYLPAQRIFYTKDRNRADYIIYITESQNRADWVVMKTSWDGDAKNGRWKEVSWESSADIRVFITTIRREADKVVCFTKWSSQIKFDY